MHPLCDEYKQRINFYEDFRDKVEGLIREILINKEISFHKIESRTKDPVRLDEKILRKEEKYNGLDEITDLVGIRVITYFEDTVDEVAAAIEAELDVDNENSIDKRKLDIDRFGYKSLHYVVSLKSDRQQLIEYKRFGSKKVEIQIRSILQHAWAEIEHDLGYKSKSVIPNDIKRDFYLAAAFLEKADKDFVFLRKQIVEYEDNVTSAIVDHPEEVDINSASLKAYVLSSDIVSEIDQHITQNSDSQITHSSLDFSISKDAVLLRNLNVNTIKQLDQILRIKKDIIIEFAKKWLDKMKELNGLLPKGISIFYLCYIIAAESKDEFQIEAIYQSILDEDELTNFGKEILHTYAESSKNSI